MPSFIFTLFTFLLILEILGPGQWLCRWKHFLCKSDDPGSILGTQEWEKQSHKVLWFPYVHPHTVQTTYDTISNTIFNYWFVLCVFLCVCVGGGVGQRSEVSFRSLPLLLCILFLSRSLLLNKYNSHCTNELCPQFPTKTGINLKSLRN